MSKRGIPCKSGVSWEFVFIINMSASVMTTLKNQNDSKKYIINMNNLTNQTRKDLIVIAKTENVPYSGLNKSTLIDRIQHYRDTVGTLYREKKSSLKALAKAENIRGYGGLNKRKLIDTILYHRRVVQPQIKDLSSLRKSELVKLAKKEGLKIVGGKKARIAQNIAINRVSSRISSMKVRLLNWHYQSVLSQLNTNKRWMVHIRVLG